MKENTCTFLGHRRLWSDTGKISSQLKTEIHRLVFEKNVTEFLCGGMVDHSAYLICHVTESFGGAWQTLRYAQKQDIEWIPVACDLTQK